MDAFVNCLILEVRQKDYTFTMQLLTLYYKDCFMPRMDKIIEVNQDSTTKHRLVWLAGEKKKTEAIKEMLDKHMIRPRILRDSFMRRDYVHYFKGHIVVMNKRDFRDMQRLKTVSR